MGQVYSGERQGESGRDEQRKVKRSPLESRPRSRAVWSGGEMRRHEARRLAEYLPLPQHWLLAPCRDQTGQLCEFRLVGLKIESAANLAGSLDKFTGPQVGARKKEMR